MILDHMFGWPSGGFIGVDVFFVISGFLITGLMLRERERTGRISWSDFYRRRMRRIFPAATTTLVTVVIASYLVYLPARFDAIRTDALWSFFFVSNWRFAVAGTDYLQAGGPVSPLQHFWSLAVEEQFYIMWPALLIVLLGVAGVSGRSRLRSPARGLALAMLVIIVGSFAWALWETSTAPSWAYFSTVSRCWELAAGAFLALYAHKLTRLSALGRTLLAYLGLAAIAAALFLITPTSAFPGPWAALPVAGAVAVLAAGCGGHAPFLWLLRNRASVYIGTISYSLYLWHFPVIILLGSLMPKNVGYYLLCLGAMTAFAVLSFRFVEEPVRRSAWLEPKPHHRRASTAKRTIGGGTLAMLTVGCLVLVSAALQRQDETGFVVRTAEAATQTPGRVSAADPSARSAQLNAALDATEWPTLTPSIDEAVATGWPAGDGEGCVPADPDGHSCDYTDIDPSKLVLVAGDSIAAAWLPGIRAALEPAGWVVRSVTYPGCPFVEYDTTGSDESRAAECPASREAMVEAINRARPALLIISSQAGYRFAEDSKDGRREASWNEGVREILERVRPTIGHLIVLKPPPRGKAPAECATRFSSPADCTTHVSQTLIRYAEIERNIAVDFGGAYVDTTPWFCAEGRGCPIFAGGIPIRRDGTHLTPKYASGLAPEIVAALGVGSPPS